MIENKNINPSFSSFDRQERIEWWNQKKLFDSKVLVVGAGALGNEVIKNLSLLGIGHMFIVDFDKIEDTNLSRAVLFREDDVKEDASKAYITAARSKALNPNKNATVTGLHGDVVWDLGLGVYRHSDIVLGCLDNVEARLSVNLNSWKTGKIWIDGGMWELAGSVSVYSSIPHHACYECGMTQEHYKSAKTRYSCTNLVVKNRIKQGFEPTTQTTSAVIGAFQSQEAVKVLHNLPSFDGRRLMFSGAPHYYLEDNSPTYLIDLSVNEVCICHKEEKLQEVYEFPDLTNQVTLNDFFSIVQNKVGDGDLSLDLNLTFIVSSSCPYCGDIMELDKPKHRVKDVELVCTKCEVICPSCGAVNVGVPDCSNCGQEDIFESRLVTFREIQKFDDEYEKYKKFRLCDLGVPLLQILKVNIGTREYFVELTGDIFKVWM